MVHRGRCDNFTRSILAFFVSIIKQEVVQKKNSERLLGVHYQKKMDSLRPNYSRCDTSKTS